jgi:hypothetical protein
LTVFRCGMICSMRRAHSIGRRQSDFEPLVKVVNSGRTGLRITCIPFASRIRCHHGSSTMGASICRVRMYGPTDRFWSLENDIA